MGERLTRTDAVSLLGVLVGADVGMAVGAPHHDDPGRDGCRRRATTSRSTSGRHRPAASIGAVTVTSSTEPTAPLSVCVYCSSSDDVSHDLRALAEAVGTGLARRGWAMVYGGGAVGLMGVTARAALAGGARVTGVIPDKLVDREVALHDISELIRTRTMRERKQLMDDRSDAFLILPGGIGTLEELIEMMSLRQLGYHDRPIVVLDADGFWAPLRRLLQAMDDRRMLHQPMHRLWTYAHDVDAALDALGNGSGRRSR
ncbi:MAG TPA: TIGR00730 family Rossman fold protein [Euzebyales bacterium]